MTTDKNTTLDELKTKVKKMCDDRDWTQFHTPKDVAMTIVLEAAEILEPFRYKTTEQCLEFLNDPVHKKEISDELADTLFNMLRFAQLYDIDLSRAFHDKLSILEKKYPVELAKGKAHKYTAYQNRN